MLSLVVYDISSNRSRRKVFKKCEGAGLIHVQKSVFIGMLSGSRLDEFEMQVKSLVKQEEDDVMYIVPIDMESFNKIRTIGKDFDRERVTASLNALFL